MYVEKARKQSIEHKAINYPVAAKNYNFWLKLFCNEFPDREIEEIESMELVEWIDKLKDKYAEGSVKQAKCALRFLLKYCQQEGREVVDYDRFKVPKTTSNSHVAVKREEFEELRDLCEVNEFYNITNRLILDLLWDTGIRVSELSELKMKQMDFQNNVAKISSKKNHKHRMVLWSDRTARTLEKYLPVRRKLGRNDRLLLGRHPKTGQVYNQLSTRSIQSRVKKLVKESSIERTITPHSFRHGRAHEWRRKGASLAFIKEALGHATVETTKIYQQYEDPEFEREAKQYIED